MRDGVKSSSHSGNGKVTYMSRLARGRSITAALAISATLQNAQAVTIDTVPVGNPGNGADSRYVDAYHPNSVGAVNYAFRIGETECKTTICKQRIKVCVCGPRNRVRIEVNPPAT